MMTQYTSAYDTIYTVRVDYFSGSSWSHSSYEDIPLTISRKYLTGLSTGSIDLINSSASDLQEHLLNNLRSSDLSVVIIGNDSSVVTGMIHSPIMIPAKEE